MILSLSGPEENVVLGGAFQFNDRLPTWKALKSLEKALKSLEKRDKRDQLKLEKVKTVSIWQVPPPLERLPFESTD
jgi:hypothetical protein